MANCECHNQMVPWLWLEAIRGMVSPTWSFCLFRTTVWVKNNKKPGESHTYEYYDLWTYTTIFIYIWVNYNISRTWNVGHLGMISLTNHYSSEGEQWGRYSLPRSIYKRLCVSPWSQGGASCDCWYTRSQPAFSSINLSYLEIYMLT